MVKYNVVPCRALRPSCQGQPPILLHYRHGHFTPLVRPGNRRVHCLSFPVPYLSVFHSEVLMFHRPGAQVCCGETLRMVLATTVLHCLPWAVRALSAGARRHERSAPWRDAVLRLPERALTATVRSISAGARCQGGGKRTRESSGAPHGSLTADGGESADANAEAAAHGAESSRRLRPRHMTAPGALIAPP